jgi:hypothetical protein
VRFIHGELLKLGIEIGETSVSKYMVRQRKSPSRTRRTFLDNHVHQIVSGDFFSRLIRPRNGLPSNFAMLSPGTRHHTIFCEIAIESSATPSPDRSTTWA